jgi:3-dehydroquinate dehydratase-1
MKTVTVKNVEIGAGRPKIIVPIAATTSADALAAAARLATEDALDLIEFRVDFLDIALDKARIARVTREVAEIAATKPILVTFRTKAEGGAAALDDPGYAEFYTAILREGRADLIDVELMRDENIVRRLVDEAHRAGVRVVMSNHDFAATAPTEELVARMRRMQELDADILKIATMPLDAGDVLKLLNATWVMHSQYTDRPLITMSMAGKGVISRLSGELFGSAATFGMVGQASAPGQLALPDLRMVLELINRSLGQNR